MLDRHDVDPMFVLGDVVQHSIVTSMGSVKAIEFPWINSIAAVATFSGSRISARLAAGVHAISSSSAS